VNTEYPKGGLSDAFYHQDINASWEGERFAVRGQSEVFAYDEATGEISLSEGLSEPLSRKKVIKP